MCCLTGFIVHKSTFCISNEVRGEKKVFIEHQSMQSNLKWDNKQEREEK